MNVVFHNYLSCSWLLENEPAKWDAIVILDPGLQESGFLEAQTSRHLILRFDDVEQHTPGKQLVTQDDLSAAFDFASDSKNLVVSCRAGQSRSAALAFSIAFKLIDANAAVSLWNPKRHSPNRLILELASELIDVPEFQVTYEKWLHDNRSISLTDYLDQIEQEFDDLEAAGARNQLLR